MSAANSEPDSILPTTHRGGPGALHWPRLEARLEWLGDRLNPILVKETRQALKSRQFAITFVLLLIGGWFWSFAGPAFIGPRIYFSPAGQDMFFGYYLILAFPLAVIVPYSAFRSLAAEREDNTYELLSISTLASHQIVSGKLGSAAVQMLVYFSALAPCLAFTYLLRGIDIVTIGMLLYYTAFGSLGLAMIGLLFAAALRSRFGQVVLSLVLIVGLLLAFWLAGVVAYALLSFGPTFGEFHELSFFWVFNIGMLLCYGSYFALAFLAASALLTFESENRSSGMRVVMLLQNVLWGGWVGTILMMEGWDRAGIVAFVLVSGIHWFVMGAFLTSETATVSRRVQRRLPSSLLGRTLFTWFNPGPATGYVFVVANLTALVLLALASMAMEAVLGSTASWPANDELSCFLVLGHSYVTFYLGLGLLLLRLTGRWGNATFVVATGIQLLLVLTGTMAPIVVQFSLSSLRTYGYTAIQITNPFWTLAEAVDGGFSLDLLPAMLVVPAAAAGVFLFHVPAVLREISMIKTAAPARVQEDDRSMAPPPPQPPPQSPWD